jgi:hypothetical protein
MRKVIFGPILLAVKSPCMQRASQASFRQLSTASMKIFPKRHPASRVNRPQALNEYGKPIGFSANIRIYSPGLRFQLGARRTSSPAGSSIDVVPATNLRFQRRARSLRAR